MDVYIQNSICSHYSTSTITFTEDNFFFNSQNNEKGVQVLESHGSNKLKASRKYIKICNPESKLRQVSAFQN